MVTCPSCWTASLCWTRATGLRPSLRPLSLVPHRVYERSSVVRVGVLVASPTFYFLKGKTIAQRKKSITFSLLCSETSDLIHKRCTQTEMCLNCACKCFMHSSSNIFVFLCKIVQNLHTKLQLPCTND